MNNNNQIFIEAIRGKGLRDRDILDELNKEGIFVKGGTNRIQAWRLHRNYPMDMCNLPDDMLQPLLDAVDRVLARREAEAGVGANTKTGEM